jgi:hypothetical protein
MLMLLFCSTRHADAAVFHLQVNDGGSVGSSGGSNYGGGSYSNYGGSGGSYGSGYSGGHGYGSGYGYQGYGGGYNQASDVRGVRLFAVWLGIYVYSVKAETIGSNTSQHARV